MIDDALPRAEAEGRRFEAEGRRFEAEGRRFEAERRSDTRATFGASRRRSRDASRTTRPSRRYGYTPNPGNPAPKTPTARRAPRPHRGEAPSDTSRTLSRRPTRTRTNARRGTRPRRNRRTFRIRVLVRVERRRASSRDARRRRQTPTTVWWRMGAARAANATAGSRRTEQRALRTLHAREGVRPAGGVEVGRFFLLRVASRTPGAAGVPSSRRRAGGCRRRGARASHRRGGRSPGESRGPRTRGSPTTPRGSSCCSSTAW